MLTADAAGAAGPHPGTGPLPDDIRIALHTLSDLPPAQDVETAALPDAGDWCFNIPLWGNPVLPNSATGAEEEGETAPAAAPRVPDPDFLPEDEDNGDAATEMIQAGCLPRRGLESRHARLAACTAVRTVGDAVRVGRAAEAAPQGAAWEHWIQIHLTPRSATRGHALEPGEEAQEPTAGAAAGTPLEVARARTVLDFWQRAQGFTELGVPRHGWEDVGPYHPILSVVDGRLVCAQSIGLGDGGEEE